MRRLILIVSIWALATARPETYREKEDFQYSRSSSDDGTKAGFYGAQRGNMGGNYERAHNMDSLAQHQMGSLVTQVEGELGSGADSKSGSVYTAGNSRGVFGSGHYDLSALKGRNFAEGTSYVDSEAHSSALDSGYQGHAYATKNARYNSRQSQSSSQNLGYQTAGQAGSYFDTNNQEVDNSQYSGLEQEYRNQAASNYKYHSQASNQGSRQYDQSILNSNGASGSNAQIRSMSATPLKVYVRPGTKVTIPITAQTYDASQLGLSHSENAISSDAELLGNSRPVISYAPTNKAKHYESSYSYRKAWEKHDTLPLITPTENPFPKNSDLYDADGQVFSQNSNLNTFDVNSAQDSKLSNAYTSGYRANSKLSSAHESRYQTGYNAENENTAAGAHSISHSVGAHTGNLASANNLIEDLSTKPKSYQSSYSYHKSWERQGDPYVIKPASGDLNGLSSQRLTAASEHYGQHSSHQYGSHHNYAQHAYSQSGTPDCDENGLIRVPRSYNNKDYQDVQEQNYFGQQQQSGWENLEDMGQQTQGKWENFEDLGQQSENKWDQLQDLDKQIKHDLEPQSQNKWDNFEAGSQQAENKHDESEDLGQQSQKKWDNLEAVGQQSENKHEELENLGQLSQNKWDNLEDLGQQSQNKWDNLEAVGQQAENKHNKLEDLGQQSQDKWNNLETLSQHASNNNEKLEDYGQQSQNKFDNLEVVGQHAGNNDDEALEDLGQETQNKWNNLETLSQQSQNQFNNVEDMGQQTQNEWDHFENLGQQIQNNHDTQSNQNTQSVLEQQHQNEQSITYENQNNIYSHNKQLPHQQDQDMNKNTLPQYQNILNTRQNIRDQLQNQQNQYEWSSHDHHKLNHDTNTVEEHEAINNDKYKNFWDQFDQETDHQEGNISQGYIEDMKNNKDEESPHLFYTNEYLPKSDFPKTIQAESPLNSLWGKLDQISGVSQVQSSISSTANNSNKYWTQDYNQNFWDTQQSTNQNDFFDFDSTQFSHPVQPNNNMKNKNISEDENLNKNPELDQSKNSYHQPQSHIGRGDIESEDTLEESSSDLSNYEASIKVESLSLTKKENTSTQNQKNFHENSNDSHGVLQQNQNFNEIIAEEQSRLKNTAARQPFEAISTTEILRNTFESTTLPFTSQKEGRENIQKKYNTYNNESPEDFQQQNMNQDIVNLDQQYQNLNTQTLLHFDQHSKMQQDVQEDHLENFEPINGHKQRDDQQEQNFSRETGQAQLGIEEQQLQNVWQSELYNSMQQFDHTNIQLDEIFTKKTVENLNQANMISSDSVPKNHDVLVMPIEVVTEKPGFWKSIGSKLTNAKDSVVSWLKRS